MKQAESVMNKRLMRWISGLAAAGLTALAAAYPNQAKAESKAEYFAAGDAAAAEYMKAHAQCETLNTSLQSVCIEEAKLAQTRAKGTAEAKYRNTAQARQKARTDIVNAEYRVAEARCQSQDGNVKNVCIRQAKTVRVEALANVKASQ